MLDAGSSNGRTADSGSAGLGSNPSPAGWPLRLVAQDVGFSVRKQGFDSPRGYFFLPGAASLHQRRPFLFHRGTPSSIYK